MGQYESIDFVNKKYKPTTKDLLCEFYAEPIKGLPFHKLCNHLAGESSIGTWTEVTTINKRIKRTLKPIVYYANPRTKTVKIAYPEALFELGNMPSILSSIAGNIYGMKACKNLRLQDISFSKNIVKSFKGPRYGIKDLRRKIFKVSKRPLVGTIVKPKVGLTSKEHAKVAYEAWVGGLDVVKDDENLTSQSFNKYTDRFKLTLRARDKAEKETGERKIYLANITAESNEMLKRAKLVQHLGGEFVMVDILTAGWAALQTVRDNVPQAIHGHRAMHAAFTRNPKHGISMLVLAKVARLIGCDQLHIGTANVGKMEGSRLEAKYIEDDCEKMMIKENKQWHVLQQEWDPIKPMLAVASGGLHPGHIPTLLKRMGNDIVMQFGGGCHGHPGGTRIGATAIRQATEAAMNNIPLREYAKLHPELQAALDLWMPK